MFTRCFSLLLAFAGLALSLSAQQGRTELIGTEQGLSQGMVYDILQSRDGFLWIATKDGLNRYDGYRFEVHNHDPFDPFSIGTSEIRRLYEDSRGRLWLTYEGGIDLFDPGAGRFFHLPLPDIGFNGYVESFAEMPDGAMWLTCFGQLLKIDLTTAVPGLPETPFPAFTRTNIEAPPSAVPDSGAFRWNAVFFHPKHQLLAASNTGVYRLDARTGAPAGRAAALPGNFTSILGTDERGNLWLQTSNALRVWNPASGTTVNIPVEAQSLCRLDALGNLLYYSKGLVRQWRPAVLIAGGKPDIERTLTQPDTPAEAYYLTTIYTDRANNLWMGTSGYGLLKTALVPPKFSSHLPVQSLRALVETPEGEIMSMRDPKRLFRDKRFVASDPNPWLARFPPGKTACLARFDASGDCWVRACEGDLYRVDARTKTPVRFDAKGVGLLIGRKGQVLGLTETALLALDPRTGQLATHPLPGGLRFHYNVANYFNFLMEDEAGTLWIWAFKGLLKATPAGTGYRFEHFVNNPQDRATLGNNLVLCAADDLTAPDRFLWVGTKGGGLNRLDKQTGRVAHFKTEQGLPDNVVYGILPDDGGHLWLSTNKGLCRFNPRDYSIKNFSAADGLQSNEFNQGSFLKTSDGHLVFGGVNGLTVFHPDSLRFNEHVPLVRIVGLRVNNDRWPLPGASPLLLRHHQNVLVIEAAALDLTNPAQNQYRYQLEEKGFFKKSPPGTVELGAQRTVSFANLQPGRYVFRVWGSNNDGIWNPDPAVLEFTIRPPWWATWWAYLAYAALLAVAFAVFNHYRLRRRLVEQESLRLRELDEFKSRFFTNVTHEFRTPLTVILGMAERLERETGAGASERVTSSDGATSSHPVTMAPKDRSPAVLIKRSGENLLRLVNQILDLAKLESGALRLHYVQGDVTAYLRYIAESLHSAADMRGVRLRVDGPDTPIVMDYDPERLLQIVHNLLSNAIKFTPSGGEVVLRIGLLNLQGLVNLNLQVSDTGIGIPPDDLPYIFDRFYQANNLEKASPSLLGRAGVGHGGTGIGLALTKELVQALGGAISVESKVGKGTAFTVRLPISNKAAAHGDGVTASHPVTPSVPVTSEFSDGVTASHPVTASDVRPALLLVEDNPDVLEYLAACLAPHYALDFAANGRIGIEKAIETVPDLIVSDVMMPEKDGFEVCETLKNDERTSHIPIVLLTAKADVQNRIAGLRRGADAYLGKPFHEEELLVTLANLLDLRKKLQAKYAAHSLNPSPAHPLAPSPAHPLAPSPDPEDAFLQKVRAVVERQISEPELDMSRLEQALAMSRSQLFRKIKALTGRSPSQFVRAIRLHRGRQLLQTTNLTVSEIAYEVGFSSVKYFSDAFLEEFGERPTGVRG